MKTFILLSIAATTLSFIESAQAYSQNQENYLAARQNCMVNESDDKDSLDRCNFQAEVDYRNALQGGAPVLLPTFSTQSPIVTGVTDSDYSIRDEKGWLNAQQGN